MTPVFCCGFECGQFGAVGQHWQTPTGNVTFDTTTKRNGARSLRANSSAAVTQIQSGVAPSNAIYVMRFHVYFATLPTGSNNVLFQSNRGGAIYNISDSKIYTHDVSTGTTGSTGVLVTSNRWYCIDIVVNVSSNPWTIDVKVDGTPCSQLTRATTATTNSSITLFNAPGDGTWTGDIYVDDFVLSNTLADYPIGPGAVRHFIPTSDGTHNVAGTADFTRTLTGTDILNATTTAFQLIDDVPLESGSSVDWINMVAPPNATDYVECVFGPAAGVNTPVVAPRAVEVIAGIHQAGTGTGNMEIRINDNGTLDNMYSATTVAGVTSVAYKRKHYAAPPTGGAWKVVSGAGNFNNLRMRFGSPSGGVDANPDQYLDCIMIEAEFPEPQQNIIQTRQSINRSNHY